MNSPIKMRLPALVLSLVATLLLSACSNLAREPQPSLYDRLGGKEALTAVVGHLWTLVAADERINGRFANTAPDAFAGQLVDFLCQGTGGPCTYSGKSMTDAHRGMNLSEAEFMALGEDVALTLDHFKVPAAEKQEVMELLLSMKAQVINH